MKLAAVLALIMATAATAAAQVLGGATSMPGVQNPVRARQNWILKCQGCHRPDASGTPQTTPAMAGVIGRFLTVPGGREYLGQVPGVATAALPDAELTELLNWTLLRFDPAHVPKDFKPYTVQEVGELRRKPLRTEAAQIRARITARLNAGRNGASSGQEGEGSP